MKLIKIWVDMKMFIISCNNMLLWFLDNNYSNYIYRNTRPIVSMSILSIASGKEVFYCWEKI